MIIWTHKVSVGRRCLISVTAQAVPGRKEGQRQAPPAPPPPREASRPSTWIQGGSTAAPPPRSQVRPCADHQQRSIAQVSAPLTHAPSPGRLRRPRRRQVRAGGKAAVGGRTGRLVRWSLRARWLPRVPASRPLEHAICAVRTPAALRYPRRPLGGVPGFCRTQGGWLRLGIVAVTAGWVAATGAGSSVRSRVAQHRRFASVPRQQHAMPPPSCRTWWRPPTRVRERARRPCG